ncbi:MAG: LysR family transcriptional regulator, partial [Geodermatophilaceae bacterium]|nr:LysR family transcriptional regulator [Geodermatophilaceae bacterium]
MIGGVDQSWQRIELRHLLALDAVESTGSFREAASRLGYSLSTISDQIASLEQLVGIRL